MKTLLVCFLLFAGSVQAAEPLWYSEYRSLAPGERQRVLKVAITMVYETVSLFGEDHAPRAGLPPKREFMACLEHRDADWLEGALRDYVQMDKTAPGKTSLEGSLFFAILDKCKVAEPYWPRRF